MNKILQPEDQKKMISYGKNTPSAKTGGSIQSIYPTKMKDCGCKKK